MGTRHLGPSNHAFHALYDRGEGRKGGGNTHTKNSLRFPHKSNYTRQNDATFEKSGLGHLLAEVILLNAKVGCTVTQCKRHVLAIAFASAIDQR